MNDAKKNFKTINIKFFVPESTIQKASALYAIQLEREGKNINI